MPNNSPARVRELLQSAASVIEESGIPPDLRAAAFAKAVDLLASEASPREPETTDPVLVEAAEGRIARIAKALGITPELASRFLEVDEEDVLFAFPRSRLPKAKAPAMRNIALLYASSRQSGNYDQGWTTAEALRERCREFGVLDVANFATETTRAGDVFVLRGKGPKREYKVTKHGFEEAGRMLAEIAAAQG